MSSSPEIVWSPDPDEAALTPLAAFTRWVRQHRGVEARDYAALHSWSVSDLDGFWSAVAEFCGMRFRQPPRAVLGSRLMPGVQWFPGATLNYAEHALTPAAGRADEDLAGQCCVGRSQHCPQSTSAATHARGVRRDPLDAGPRWTES